MMKKNGFISISIIYSFFLVFLLLLIVIMSTYVNTRETLRVYKNDVKAKVVSGNTLADANNYNINTYVRYLADDPTTGVVHQTFSYVSTNYDAGYYFTGTNPNNYIKFNNELWRIVGVFDDKTHGIANTYLTKIVRNEAYSAAAYNTAGANNYSSSSIKTTLNNISAYTGSAFVQSVTWKASGLDTYNTFGTGVVNNFYLGERGITSTASNYNGKVGLLSASDFGYAAGTDNRTKCMMSLFANWASSNASCVNENWLYKSSCIWTNTRYTGNNTDMFVACRNNPNIKPSKVTNSAAIYPTVYLKDSVILASGSGKIDDPYIIK